MTYDEATRSSIISAGLKLFHEASIAEVMVDDIAREAGVNKKIFYKFFKKKDEFIVECYKVHSRYLLGIYETAAQENARAVGRVQAIFDLLERVAKSDQFIGCGLMRAGASLGRRSNHPLRAVVSDFKKTVENSFMLALARDGYAEPDRIAREIALVLDGALAHVMYHRDASYARDGARLAMRAIEAARMRGPNDRH